MTVVSSYRPFGRFQDIDRNQIIAKHSWDQVFDGIVYLNPFNVKLWSETTLFTGTTNRPRMMELFITAALLGGVVAVVNSDIVIGADARYGMEDVFKTGAACGYSFRYQFNPDRMDLGQARQVDSGLDFFVAHSNVWFKTFSDCPDRFVIGNGEWDSWLLEYWQRKYRRACVNLTSRKLVFHPNHGNREREPDVVLV